MRVLDRKDPTAEWLSRLPLFKDAGRVALHHLSSAADEVHVPAGTTLISQSHFHRDCFVIVDGRAQVEVAGHVVAEIPAGQTIGELGIFKPGPATATIRAKSDMTVLVIPYTWFDQLLDHDPKLTRAIARELADRLRGEHVDHVARQAPGAETVDRWLADTASDTRLREYAHSMVPVRSNR